MKVWCFNVQWRRDGSNARSALVCLVLNLLGNMAAQSRMPFLCSPCAGEEAPARRQKQTGTCSTAVFLRLSYDQEMA